MYLVLRKEVHNTKFRTSVLTFGDLQLFWREHSSSGNLLVHSTPSQENEVDQNHEDQVYQVLYGGELYAPYITFTHILGFSLVSCQQQLRTIQCICRITRTRYHQESCGCSSLGILSLSCIHLPIFFINDAIKTVYFYEGYVNICVHL